MESETELEIRCASFVTIGKKFKELESHGFCPSSFKIHMAQIHMPISASANSHMRVVSSAATTSLF